MTLIYNREDAPDIAYNLYKGGDGGGLTPVVFLGGFRSDKEGTKAVYLEEKCKAEGRPFLRFDYSGHGQSGEEFKAYTLSHWAQDARDIITHCFDVPVILVGSSMGGWVSLILAEHFTDKIVGIVGLAAAPDFTQWFEAQMSDAQKQELKSQGYFDVENDYGPPYPITQKLLDDGRDVSLLHKKIKVPFPIILIQGKKDADVPWETAEKIKDVFDEGENDLKIVYIEDGDHRLSKPEELESIWQATQDIINA